MLYDSYYKSKKYQNYHIFVTNVDSVFELSYSETTKDRVCHTVIVIVQWMK